MMDSSQFERLVEEIRKESLDTLIAKNAKYAPDRDKLHNFNAGAEIFGGTAAQTAWGYLTKHLVALRDMVQRNDFSDRKDLLEKCKDSINYICFIWCIANAERAKYTTAKLDVDAAKLDDNAIAHYAENMCSLTAISAADGYPYNLEPNYNRKEVQ